MAYLTNYNLGQLSQKLSINTDVSLDFFLEHIYNDQELYSILNKRETEYLFKYKMLIDNEVRFVVEYYNEVPEREDTRKFVFNRGGRMKYHLNPDCKLIRKDYVDFIIPEEIRAFGDDAIIEYRNWFDQNKFGEKYRSKTIDKNVLISAFNLKYPAKYKIKPIEDNSNLFIIKQPNSKYDSVDSNYDAEKTKQKLELLKNEWNRHFPCRTTKIIAKFKHLLNRSDEEINSKITELFSDVFITNYGLHKLKNKFSISRTLTNEIIKLLLEHIKWTYKLEDKNFDNATLEKFGLECCLGCAKENNNS